MQPHTDTSPIIIYNRLARNNVSCRNSVLNRRPQEGYAVGSLGHQTGHVKLEVRLLDRDYGRSPHPPTCTCVTCTERRNKSAGRSSVGDRMIGRGGNWSVMIGAAAVIIVIVVAILTVG